LVAALGDRTAERQTRSVFEEIAGSKNVLSDDLWREYGSLGLGDGSENYNYLSVPFEL
jgi:hypothetical protein